MTQMKPLASTPTVVATLIGDLVGSRESARRQQLHDRLRAVLEAADRQTGPVRPTWITAGDEFQGVHRTVGEALHAALLIRLALHPADCRFGLGWGPVTVLDEDGNQDGPGWWSARAAIESVAADQDRPATRTVRTAYRRADERQDGPTPQAVNAALVCRDHLLGSLDDRATRILSGLVDGMTQTQIATQEHVSVSAVSQRVRSAGVGAVLHAHAMLREV